MILYVVEYVVVAALILAFLVLTKYIPNLMITGSDTCKIEQA